MDQEEKLQILRSARLLEEYENTPEPLTIHMLEMSDIEKSKLIIYLQELLEEQKATGQRAAGNRIKRTRTG